MKTTTKKILLVVIMLGTFIGYAKMNTEPTNTVVDSKKVKVEFESVKMGQAITIKDNLGKILCNRLAEQDGVFSKSFDLSALPNGEYKVELDRNFETIIKPFSIKNGLVTFMTDENKRVLKPIIRRDGNLLYISKTTAAKKPLNIIVYYNDKAIIKDMVKKELSKVYKLSDNYKGDYRIVIKSSEREYLEII